MTPESTARDEGQQSCDLGFVRRTPEGWRVHSGEEVPDLLNAMVLADLLVAEEQPPTGPSTAPPRASKHASEVERLRTTVTQLEHALHTRVIVEQAIGVLAERHRLKPREAFQRLRSAARSRGRKVVDLAREVVTSSTAPFTALPGELAGECASGG